MHFQCTEWSSCTLYTVAEFLLELNTVHLGQFKLLDIQDAACMFIALPTNLKVCCEIFDGFRWKNHGSHVSDLFARTFFAAHARLLNVAERYV